MKQYYQDNLLRTLADKENTTALWEKNGVGFYI
jgi:hypothetical protein